MTAQDQNNYRNYMAGLNPVHRWFGYVFLLGFLLKYNYLLLRIFTVPSITGLMMRNITFLVVIACFMPSMVRSRRGRRHDARFSEDVVEKEKLMETEKIIGYMRRIMPARLREEAE